MQAIVAELAARRYGDRAGVRLELARALAVPFYALEPIEQGERHLGPLQVAAIAGLLSDTGSGPAVKPVRLWRSYAGACAGELV